MMKKMERSFGGQMGQKLELIWIVDANLGESGSWPWWLISLEIRSILHPGMVIRGNFGTTGKTPVPSFQSDFQRIIILLSPPSLE